MKTATVIGWHGKLNIGDDIMLEVITERLIKHGIERLNLWCAEDQYQTSPYRDVYSFDVESRKLSRMLSRLKSLSSDSILIIGGGSILHSLYSVLWKMMYVFWTRVSNPKCKIYLLGVSYGPFKNRIAEQLGMILLNTVDQVVIRESSTFDRIKRNNGKIKCGFDLAVLHPTLSKAVNDSCEQVKAIAVSVKGSGDVYSESVIDRIAEALKAVKATYDVKIGVFVLCSDMLHGDSQASEYLVKNLPFQVEVNIYNGEVSEFINQMNTYELHIATRLHGQIVARFLNRVLLPISYHPKCDDILKEMGYGEADVFGIGSFTSQDLQERIIKVIESDGDSNSRWDKRNLIEKAGLNFGWE